MGDKIIVLKISIIKNSEWLPQTRTSQLIIFVVKNALSHFGSCCKLRNLVDTVHHILIFFHTSVLVEDERPADGAGISLAESRLLLFSLLSLDSTPLFVLRTELELSGEVIFFTYSIAFAADKFDAEGGRASGELEEDLEADRDFKLAPSRDVARLGFNFCLEFKGKSRPTCNWVLNTGSLPWLVDSWVRFPLELVLQELEEADRVTEISSWSESRSGGVLLSAESSQSRTMEKVKKITYNICVKSTISQQHKARDGIKKSNF